MSQLLSKYSEDTPIEQRGDRQLGVSPADQGGDLNGGFIVTEGFWDEMAGHYWGMATGSVVFRKEAEAREWINTQGSK